MRRLKPSYLYRDAQAGERLELFMVAGISSLLLTRFYLTLTGFPQLGGANLHIAHMLPGGLLMLLGIIILVSFIGSRAQRLASVLGGIGFGLFIDELGKFITNDNDYFFQPTIALIYLTFILLFILFRSLARHRYLTQPEYLLNALVLTQEAVINDLEPAELNRALLYLDQADAHHPLVQPLRKALQQMQIVPEAQDSLAYRVRHWFEVTYSRLITMHGAVLVIASIFIAKVAIFFVSVGSDVITTIQRPSGQELVIITWLQVGSSLLSAAFVAAGVFYLLRGSRLRAFELFNRSLLIDIFISQFFSFYRHEFKALPGFILNVLLYLGLQVLITQERRRRLAHVNS